MGWAILSLLLQAEELLKELVFDYDNPGVKTVVDKLKAALSKMPEAAIQPSAHLPALQAFSLSTQVTYHCCLHVKIC